MPRSTALVVNPTAGRGHGRQLAESVAPLFVASGIATSVIEGKDARDAVTRVQKAIAEGVGSIVVVGGDGMLHLFAPALIAGDIPVGIIPAGTGNDVARSLGIDRSDPVAAARVVMGDKTLEIDLAQVDGQDRVDPQYVVTVVACGFDAKVNERANAMRRPRGQLRYTLATIAELGVFTPLRYTLEVEGVTRDLEAMLVAVGNGPSYGGGLRICEGAVLDDGLLDVVIIKAVSKPELLRVFPRLYTGTHITHPQYEHHRVSSISVASAGVVAYGDGEHLGSLPITVRSLPRALRVFVP